MGLAGQVHSPLVAREREKPELGVYGALPSSELESERFAFSPVLSVIKDSQYAPIYIVRVLKKERKGGSTSKVQGGFICLLAPQYSLTI